MRLVVFWAASEISFASQEVSAYYLVEKIIKMIFKILLRFVMPKIG